jgi:prevent-host-death family protein
VTSAIFSASAAESAPFHLAENASSTEVATLALDKWLRWEEPPMEVGIRELRNHLSRYLDLVRDGDEVVVTARGRAIARVVPVSGERVLDRLIAEGIVTPARQPKRRAAKPIKTRGTVSDLVGEQRR